MEGFRKKKKINGRLLRGGTRHETVHTSLIQSQFLPLKRKKRRRSSFVVVDEPVVHARAKVCLVEL
jgi:hypothetical protein